MDAARREREDIADREQERILTEAAATDVEPSHEASILAASQMAELPEELNTDEMDEAQKRIYLLNKVRLRLSDYD